MKRKIISLLLCLAMVFSLCAMAMALPAAAADVPEIKNVIYMIPDGGAMAPFYLADYIKQYGGFNKSIFPNATPITTNEMYIKQYLVGAETTNNALDELTDSAASGTALASGYKTINGYIGIDPEFKPHANILEACQDLGMRTGIVVTYEWTNATPAAFSAHDISRGNMTTMSEQIVHQGIDVVFGDTHSAFSDTEWFQTDYLKSLGYDVIDSKNDLADVKSGDKLWGKLPAAYFDINRAATTPKLSELVDAAITALDGSENGFFLMVEGSAVDGGGHQNNTVNNASEFLAFDEACKVAIEYAKTRNDTIVVIAPDHDTGGLYMTRDNIYNVVYDTQNGLNSTHANWESTNHTTRNGGVFMYLPEGTPYPEGIDPSKAGQVADEFFHAYGNYSAAYPENPVNVIDNTDIVKYISSLIGVDLDAMTEKLFVDVTDMGSYNSETEVFTFSEKDITIERNRSTAIIDGVEYDLDGEVAVYIEGRFYAPAQLVEIVEAPEGHICLSANYEDLNVESWYHEDTDYVLSKGLMNGVSATEFAPSATLTRAMLVTVLHRLEGEPAPAGTSSFEDVKAEAYYGNAVFWAQENGIVNGVSENSFAPNAKLTREQIAAILYRYAQYKGMNPSVEGNHLYFDDVGEISNYAFTAMNWACAEGILNGRSETLLSPKGNATRAEIAAILHRFIED
ncbi:MAG: alkaline phosphatase [Oscillospiraceae bacterium]|nr:alkaline phosphatase [Oscillospiraceae bacterium]